MLFKEVISFASDLEIDVKLSKKSGEYLLWLSIKSKYSVIVWLKLKNKFSIQMNHREKIHEPDLYYRF